MADSMSDTMTDRTGGANGEAVSTESVLAMLWEKAEAAVALIGKLRKENRELQEQVAGLTLEIGRLRAEIDEVRASAKTEESQAKNTVPAQLMNEPDRAILVERVKEMLARIDEYL
jgi:molecular chaperone GrpE (heat shock protein)